MMELHNSKDNNTSSESIILAQYLIHTLSTPNNSKSFELIEWSKPLSKKELEEVNERLKKIELNPIFLKRYVPTPPLPVVSGTVSDKEVTTNDQSDDSEKYDHSSLVTQLVTSNTPTSEKILAKLEEEQHIKLNLVRESVEEFDIEKLREHCLTKDGLVHNSIRRAAWQILLKNSFNHKRKPKVSKHKDESQVGLDAKRSFNNFPKNLSSEKRVIKQTELNSLIKNVLRREPRLNYYQGFHDIASVLLLILDSKTAIGCLQNLSIYFLRDYLGSTLGPVIRQIGLVLYLIRLKDPELSNFLTVNQVQPYFCLSWLLTWCSHDISDLTHLARLFDVLLVSNPSLIIYFVSVVNLSRRKEILQLDDDPAMIHTYLKQFPEKYDLEDLIQKSLDLFNEYPIDKLQKESKFDLSDYSVCNTFDSSWNQITDEASYRTQYSEAQQLIKTLAKRKDTPPDISPCGMPGSDACPNPKIDKKPIPSKIPSTSFNSTAAALAVSTILIAGVSIYFGDRTNIFSWLN